MATVQPPDPTRIFLTVVDETPEFRVALNFACMRARHVGGQVAMLAVLPPVEFQQFGMVEELMRAEQREEAEALLETLGADVVQWSGRRPLVFIREGSTRDELLNLIEREDRISILVLGASTGPEGPGPLVSHLAGKLIGRLRIPLTIVPGGLTDSDLAALT